MAASIIANIIAHLSILQHCSEHRMNASDDNDIKKQRYMEQINKLLSINNADRFKLWKHFEENAEKLQTTLWDQGKWIMAIQAGVLFLPFTAKIIESKSWFPFLETNSDLYLILIIYLFGVAISMYSLKFQKEVGGHISSNFDRAICARDGSLSSISPVYKIEIFWRTTFVFLIVYILIPIVLILEKSI